jgi:hypothetical protein
MNDAHNVIRHPRPAARDKRALKHMLVALAVVAAGAMIGVPAYAQLEGVLSGTLNSNVNVVGNPAAPQDVEPAAGPAVLTNRETLALQRALSSTGDYGGELDGLWGPLTHGAVLRYQQRSGLDATGRADRATLDSLGLMVGAESPLTNP